MTATIVMNAGVPVIGSIEVTAGTPVVLTNNDDTGILGWQWTMLDLPPGSGTTLSTPNASTSTFTPDITGTYLVELRTYTDVPRTTGETIDTQAAGVRYVGSLAWRLPAAGETTQFSARGWTDEVNDILDEARTGILNAAGDISGPGSSVDERLARWDGVTGKVLQNSAVGLTDAGALSGLASARLAEQGSDPAASTNTGIIYTKDASGITELFYRDDAGAVTQVTTNGVLGVPAITQYDLVFDPSVATAGNVYGTWAGLLAALGTSVGVRSVLVRLPVSSISITEQDADLKNVRLVGRPEDRQAGRQLIFTTGNNAWLTAPLLVEHLDIRKNNGTAD